MGGLTCTSKVAIATALVYFCASPALALSIHAKAHINRAGSTFGQEQIGPIDNYTCPGNGAFPHEECDLFITCWEGSAILNRCTEVMLFDLRYNGCEIAEWVDCQDRHRPQTYPGTETPPATTPTTTTVDPSAPTSPTTPTTPQPNSTFECPANGVFPHAEKCEYYWSCFEGDAQLIHCELDYLFDLRYNGCNFPQYVDCQDRERPIGASSTVTPPETTRTTYQQPTDGTTDPGATGAPGFQCPSPDGKFRDPEDCTGFYTCVSNIPFHEYCADGLYVNPELQLCDWPQNVPDCP